MTTAKGIPWALCTTGMLLGLGSSSTAQQTAVGADEQHERRLARVQPPVHVGRARLENPDRLEFEPAAMLKFDLTNDGIVAVEDVIVRIAIFEKQLDDVVALPRAVVRPVDIRTRATIQPGFTVEYEMLFHNLAADCNCEPRITLVSARPVRY